MAKKCQQFKITDLRESLSKRKKIAEYMAEIYDMTRFYRYAGLLRGCADQTLVRTYEGGEEEILYTLFCGSRLCPVCRHRRALKSYVHLSRILNYLDDMRKADGKKPYSYILVTLTFRNVPADELKEAVENMTASFTRLTRTYEWRTAIKGAWRTLEITINPEDFSCHPHLHILCAVNQSYFTSKAYISQASLAFLWQRILGIGYLPVVHIEKVEAQDGVITEKAKFELSKYLTKPFEYIETTDKNILAFLLENIHDALQHKKQYINYGVFRKAQRELRLSDEDGDLLDITDGDKALLEQIRPDVAYVISLIRFDRSVGRYVNVDDISKWNECNFDGLMQWRYKRELEKQALAEGAITSAELDKASYAEHVRANPPRPKPDIDRAVEAMLLKHEAKIKKQ